MSEVKIPADIRIRGEHDGFPLSGEYPDFEFTCHQSNITKETPTEIMDGYGIMVSSVTPVMLLTAQGHAQTFVVCGDDGKAVYAEMGRQLGRFRG